MLAEERMRLLVKYCPLCFTEDSKNLYLKNIQMLFEMVENPDNSLSALNATVVDRSLVLVMGELWKWSVDFVMGRASPQWSDFVDMVAAGRDPKYAGMQIVAFSFDTWLRGGSVPIARARARACDIITLKKSAAAGGGGSQLTRKEKLKLNQKRDPIKPHRSEFAPLNDEQAQVCFDAFEASGYPATACVIEAANLAYRGATFCCPGGCGYHHIGDAIAGFSTGLPSPPQGLIDVIASSIGYVKVNKKPRGGNDRGGKGRGGGGGGKGRGKGRGGKGRGGRGRGGGKGRGGGRGRGGKGGANGDAAEQAAPQPEAQ